MATVSVIFGNWHTNKPVISRLNQSEVITSSGVSQTSSNTATKNDDCVEVSVTGGSVWITLDGTTPASGTGFLLPDGTTRHFDSSFGTQVKVIDA
jgi:hypothetical protein